ncbi:MAG: hypothetical protein ACI37Z_03340 [Candidatus Gastranaerophilaceae bacterium]
MVTLGSAFLMGFLLQFVWNLGVILLSVVLNFINVIGTALLEPFSFSTNMFSTVVSPVVLNAVENIIITAGISISLLLLIFGLLRVFTGRLNDDVPNPFALVGKFILAVFGCFWIIPFVNEYLFPFAQQFFNKMLNIDPQLTATSFQALAESWSDFSQVEAASKSSVLFGMTAPPGAAVSPGMALLPALIFLLMFLIFVIAATINMFKLVVENAERYFTINVLVLSGPLAISSVVSEKTSQIFKNWILCLISNILTVIFNIFGFKILLSAFSNCFREWMIGTTSFDWIRALQSLIALVAISKMAQKFDQLIAQIVFRINPIQNRSLLMSTLATFGTLDKVSKGLNPEAKGLGGAIARGANKIGTKLGIKEATSKNPAMNDLNKKSTGGSNENSNGANGKNGTNGTNTNPAPQKTFKGDLFKKPFDSDISNDLKNSLGLPEDTEAALDSDNNLISVGSMLDAVEAKNEAEGGNLSVNREQHDAIMGAINKNMQEGKDIIGYDYDKRAFIVGDAAKNGQGLSQYPEATMNMLNGINNTKVYDLKGSDATNIEDFNNYKKQYHYSIDSDNKATVYLDAKKKPKNN